MEASALRRQRFATLPGSRRLLAALGDDRLVEQVRRGNVAAFEVIYDRHYRGILSFCRHMLGSHEEAEDAVQQTFTSAFTDLQANDRDIRLKAWLYTIARNRCLSILRARREQATELEDVPTTGLSEQVQQRADLRELLRDLRDLPEEQREALVLFELGDLSQSEVASVIGVEPVKVKALVFQARSALIENREARAIPCAEIREQLATATGGALRRGPLRRHLKSCEGCSEYRDHVRAQRRALALVLPVLPSVGLKESVLGALGFGGGAGGGGVAAGGGAAAGAGAAGSSGGSVFAAIGGLSAAKLAVGATLGVGALAGGGVVVERAVDDGGSSQSAQAADKSGDQGDGGGKAAGAAAGGTPVVNGHGPRAGDDTGDEKSRDGKKDKDEKESGKKSDEKNGHSNGSDRSGDRGSSRGNSGSRSTGRSSGRRIGRRIGGNGRKGERGRRAPQGPRPGAGGGNSGNAPSRTDGTGVPATTPAAPSTESGSRGTTRGAPATAAPTDDTSTVDGAEKEARRVVPVDLTLAG